MSKTEDVINALNEGNPVGYLMSDAVALIETGVARKQKVLDIAAELHCGNLWATRDTIKDAYNYGVRVAEACGKDNAVYIMTALHVLMNTISSKLIGAANYEPEGDEE